MTRPRSVSVVIGTRPEAVKLAPVVKAIEEAGGGIECRVCVTAQHREMLDQVLDLFAIVPHLDLDIMKPDQDLYYVTNSVLEGFRDYLDRDRPDLLLVQGDTTTTFAASLAAFYRQIPVGHVEAGLRTGQHYSPFPEEMNRKMTSALASLHFPPTRQSYENLLAEGVPQDRVFTTGNTVIDALHLALASWQVKEAPQLFPEGKRGILVTAHRRENFGAGIIAICAALRQVATSRSDVHIVYPVHFNPNIRKPVQDSLSDLPNVTLLDPVDYHLFVKLMSDSHIILSDSGGVQEEAPSLGKPVLCLRDTTERPEGVQAGTVKLVGTSTKKILEELYTLLDDSTAYLTMAQAVNPYGDGLASRRIVNALVSYFDLAPVPWDVSPEYTG